MEVLIHKKVMQTLSLIFMSFLMALISGCESRLSHGNSTINEFSLSILDAAKRGDIRTILDDLTTYSDSDLKWIRSQTGKTAVQNTKESERKEVSLKDAQLWLASYSDLVKLEPSSWSIKKASPSVEAEVFSLIIWVEKGDVFEGILVAYAAKIRSAYKVVQWVSVSGSDMYHGVTKKRARLIANTSEEKVYPRGGIMYETSINK